MVKPRIIIIDTDLSYILPLQQKFIENYFEKIDLEIISNQEYYQQLFSTPQKVDVLIIAEELYTPLLQRHNIGSIFVMTEQYSEGDISGGNFYQVYKYTNINEIFNAIVGKSFGSLNISSTESKETQVILVSSAAGGVGKTTIALGISACLQKHYKRVLYMDAEHLQTFQDMLANKSPIAASDVYTKFMNDGSNLYPEIRHVIRNEGFSYLPPFKAALMALGISYSVYENLIVSVKSTKEYDYIIVDTDSVFDGWKARLIDLADKVIIVTRQNKSSVYATNTLISNINRSNTDKYIIICNDFHENEENCLVSHDTEHPYIVSDYVGHFFQSGKLKVEDLANQSDVQKLSYLIL